MDWQDLTCELQKVYKEFNFDLFSGALPEASFVIDVNKNPSFKFRENDFTIVIGQDFSNLDLIELLDDLLHEMVHISNFLNGVKDFHYSNQYHNQKFMKLANRVGLTLIKHETQGWSITTSKSIDEDDIEISYPDSDFCQKREESYLKVEENFSKDILKNAKEEFKLSFQIPKNKFFLKYSCGCPPPHNSIRSGRKPDGSNPIMALCLKCLKPYKCEE
jgi:hypothetical protein